MRPFNKMAFQSIFVAQSEAWEAFANRHVSSSCGALDNGLWDEAREPCEGSMRRDPKVRLVL